MANAWDILSSTAMSGYVKEDRADEMVDMAEVHEVSKPKGRRANPDLPDEALESMGDSYLRFISDKAHCISAEEEIALAKRIEMGDPVAKKKMIQANLRLVVHVARKYAGRGADFMDLVQEGNVGLVKAVERFNWRLGYRFSTYAMWWIRQGVLQSYAEHDRSIRLPAHIIDSISKMRKVIADIEEETRRDAQVPEIAARMGITARKVEHLMRVEPKPLSLEYEIKSPKLDTGLPTTLHETLEDERHGVIEDTLWLKEALGSLEKAFTNILQPKEQDILNKRFGLLSDSTKKMTLEAIGAEYGVTRECVRQTEKRAIAKLREGLIQHLV